MKRPIMAFVLILNLLVAGLVLPTPQGASAAATTVFVTPTNTQGWATTPDTGNGGAVNFVADSMAPGGGTGALQLTTDATDPAIAQYFHDTARTSLTSVTELSYYTKQVSGPASADPAYQLPVYVNGTAGFTTLVFEPYLQGPNNGGITPNAWQQWDVAAGRFYSTRTVTCTATGATLTGSRGGPLYTLAELKAACPDAVVLSYGLNVGRSNPSYTVRADRFNFNGTTYDFELDTDLAISKTAQPNPARAGTNVNYTITVLNTGPGDAASTVVSDTLPTGTTFVSCAATNGGVCNGGTGNARTVTFNPLPANTTATILLVANVGGTVADGTTLSNTATVTSFEPEANTDNNSSTATVMVTNPPTPTPVTPTPVTPTPVTPTPTQTTYTVNASAAPSGVVLSDQGITRTTGSGTVTPSGTTSYAAGTQASYIAVAAAGSTFVGWTLDGQYVGYASPLTFAVNSNRTLTAQFIVTPQFGDLGALGAGDRQMVTFLAALGIVNPQGVNGSGQFQPSGEVKRAEMAAFIARTFNWQDEFHANTFPDRCLATDPSNCIDSELWNDVAALKDYGIVGGYTDALTCNADGFDPPCYLPRMSVLRVQVVSIVARAFIKTPDLRPTGFWDRLMANGAQYTNVGTEGTQRSDLTTYRANAGEIPGQSGSGTFNNPEGNGSRLFVVQVLYQAFNAQFGTDRVP